MESRLAATARAKLRVFPGTNRHQIHSFRRQFVAPLPTRRPADPAVHSENPSESDVEVPKPPEAEKQTVHIIPDPIVPPKAVPCASSPKLESPAVNPSLDPIIQQKRRQTTITGTGREGPDHVSCAGLDGSPWPDDIARVEDRRRRRREQEEEDKEYYRNHKASPLSEIEVVDTRKPITRATDGTGRNAPCLLFLRFFACSVNGRERKSKREQKILGMADIVRVIENFVADQIRPNLNKVHELECKVKK